MIFSPTHHSLPSIKTRVPGDLHVFLEDFLGGIVRITLYFIPLKIYTLEDYKPINQLKKLILK
jgi:hypothetical protein